MSAAQKDPPSPAVTAAGGPVSRYRWLVTAGLVANNWARTLPTISFGLLLPAITDTFALSDSQGGWLASSVRISNGFMTLPAAVALSRFSPLRLTIVSLFLSAGATFLHGLSPTLLALFLARLGFGFTLAIRWPARAVMIQRWHPLREVPLVNGVIVGLTGGAEFVAVFLTPILLEATDSWRAVYHIYGFFGVGILLFWILLGRERRAPEVENPLASAGRSALANVLRHRQLWMIGLGTLGGAFGWFAFATFWPTYMLEENGFSLTRTGLLFGLISLSNIPASLAWGLYASRMRNWWLAIALSGLVMAGGLVGMLLTTQMWALVLLTLAVGAAWGYIPIALSLPYEIPRIGAREIAIGTSLVMTLIFIGSILGPIVAGGVSDATDSLFGALLISALLPVTVTLTSVGLKGRGPAAATT